MKTRKRHRGAALVVVLTVIILAVVLVVGLTVAMRMERSASFYDLERARAEAMARVGVDYGKALLIGATATNRFWLSSPGRITASDSNTFGAPSNLILLSSGYTNATNADVSADLNRKSLVAGDRTIDPAGTNFNFQWIYVRKDGSYTNAPGADTDGRFAFWVDDESTRVDLNTAAARSSGTPDAWPSQISLGALPGLGAYAITIAEAASNAPYVTPYDALGRDASWTNALFSDRFYLTHYTQDPDVDPWGQPRIVLSTRDTSAPQGRPYIDILGTTNADPGTYAALSAAGVAKVYTNIVSGLMRTNWPYAGTNSFVIKYGIPGISQMGVDLIEYVRSVESTNTFPEPLVAQATTNNLVLIAGATAVDDSSLTNALIGTVRRPMVSQVGLYCSANTNSLGFLGTLHVQLYLPAGYNAGSAFSGWSLWAEIASSGGGAPLVTTSTLGPVAFSGGFASCAITNVTIPATLPASIPTNSMVRLALLRSTANVITNILDIAPLKPGDRISCPTATNITAYASVNDPRLNKNLANWSASTNLTGDANPPAYSPNYSAYTGTPPSDGVTNSVYFSGPGSQVGSVGELGYLATGVSSVPSAPWRSLRLQTNSSASTNIPPDWALLDLFSAPVPSRYLPRTNVTAGRVNLNALIIDGTNQSRTNALNALFSGVANASAVLNVMNVRLAVGGNYGQAADFTNFVSIGQLCEVPGLGDQGEAGEGAIRKVASLVTVRGDVFSVYSTGQAIQFVNGRVVVNGEKTVRAMVERFWDGGQVKYKIILWSEIYP